ncbi:hypothetical protein TVAG_408310 [Trichomonas vaginalis G3]|uniref:WSN domain-containing protein n=1 Tax=Trichomonas vaginalis (strain ATCC PRA-98 / G3) TaxID=412133 RepID=A2F6N3_TRIV3|nr:hypothetical protein TVAGG3_0487570 [Trichomonas vaginalis G3]EAX99422.1 hypothetical protein TVAG_408310 [Trichomonas vaginalis G3]KAI5516143.1 hypothetical protein TVAGG3_0487570 [Trichomonas vaginalis G3]|eukprot:XP_001312352.1 hypothetical protein [Trichomonas vaginalis G3]
MSCFFLFFRVILAAKFNFSDVLTADGIDMSQLNKWKELKVLLSNFTPETQIGNLLLASVNYTSTKDNVSSPEYLTTEYNRFYRFFIDNQSRIHEFPKGNSSSFNFITDIVSRLKIQLWLYGFKIFKIKSIANDISEGKNKTTVERVVEATNLSLSHYFHAAEIAKNAMLFSQFKLKDAPPKIFMNSDKIMEMITDIPKSIEDDKINLYEVCLHFHHLMKGIIDLKNGSVLFTMKSLLAALTLYSRIAPESKHSFKYLASSFISAYDKSKKEADLSNPKIQSLITKLDPIVDNLRNQLKTHVIEVNSSVRNFVFKNMNYAKPNFKLVSFLIPHNYSFLYDDTGLISLLREEKTDLFRPFIKTIMGNSRTKDMITTYYLAKAALVYLNNPKRAIPNFTMSWSDNITFAAKHFKDIRTTTKINELLSRINVKPMDSVTIKNAISEFIEGLKEIESVYPGFIGYAIDFLNDLKDVLKDDIALGEILQIHPIGRSLSSFIEANNKYNDGVSIKDAYWDFDILGVYVMRTIQAWKDLSLWSAPNLLHSIVTKTEKAKKFLENFEKIWRLFLDNQCEINKDDIDSIYTGFSDFINKMKPGFEYFMMTPTELFYSLTNINISRFTESFYDSLLELQSGKLKWETYVKFNKMYYEDLYEPLYMKYGGGKITRLVKNILIGLAVSVIFVCLVVIIILYVLRSKLHKNESDYIIQQESVNSEVDENVMKFNI